MKKVLFIIFILNAVLVFSQKEKAVSYIEKYKVIAMIEMQRTGVPAAITLAQGILESQMGESDLCLRSNNHFGIKCKTEWTGERVYHNDDINQECFRKYSTAEESFKDHSDFLKNRPYYTSLFSIEITDFESWAKGLKACGYATDKNYAELLIRVINEYNLNHYTHLALGNRDDSTNTVLVEILKNSKRDSSAIAAKLNNSVSNSKSLNKPFDKDELKISAPTNTVIEDDKEEEVIEKKMIDTKPKANSDFPKGIFSINNTKVFWALKGTSLLSVALEYNISLAKILEYNDFEETEFIEEDQLVFIERKQKKGATDFYIVQPNETLHLISQKLGMQIVALANLNGIHKKLNPLAGEKLFLKVKAPTTPKASLANNSPQQNNINL